MARSIWKGPFVEGYVLKKAEKVRESGKHEVIKIINKLHNKQLIKVKKMLKEFT